MICKICNTEQDLRTHLKTHNITSKEYYDQYLRKEGEGICPVCGKETKFLGIQQGYRIWCSNKCHQNDKGATEKRVAAFKSSGKCSETLKHIWASKTDEEKQAIVKKVQDSNLKKYGVKAYSQTDEWKNTVPDKISVSNKNHGEEYWEEQHRQGIIKYCENNNIDYNNYTNIFQIEQVKEKCAATKEEKYNDRHYTNRKQMEQTCLDRYGFTNAMNCHDIFLKTKKKYYYDNRMFDSLPEIAYYIWLTDNNIPFEYQPNIEIKYTYNDKIHYYKPDFKVNGELHEIKGDQFFVNEKMINPFDRSQDDLYNAKYHCMLENNVKIIKTAEYKKYIDFVNKKYTPDFLPLFKLDLPFPYLNENLSDKSDMGLIHHFHKSIYEATRKNKLSPINAWNDKNIIKKIALNRLKYVGHCKPSDILQGFNVTRIANKVSVFKPSLAEELIKKYIPNTEILFDPFSGFSGRMLGAFNCGIQYFGYDINEKHVSESNEIIECKMIGDMCNVEVQDLLIAPKKDYTYLRNSALFTCPPYGGKEHWNKDNDEIEKTCDEWIDLCLEKYKVDKYLFVVDKTEKYKDNIVEIIENKSHFGKNYEYVILI